MRPLLTKKKFVLGALAAVGSGLLYYNADGPRTSMFVTTSPFLPEPLSGLWNASKDRIMSPFSVYLDKMKHGNLPIYFGLFGTDTIADAAAKVGPAVVKISPVRGFHVRTAGMVISTGTIIDSDGTILTSAHSVSVFPTLCSSSKQEVLVTLKDGRTFEGIVLHLDLQYDIGIVKINSKTPLPHAKLGSSSKLRTGDLVLAVGCPHSLPNTVTAGIISCVDRSSGDLGIPGLDRKYLQTDCAINIGSSGGPLVNLHGEIVGVNIMKALDVVGVSFAVPVDSVSTIIDHFKTYGRLVRPWIGLMVVDLKDMTVAQMKENNPSFPDVDNGVLAPFVVPGSPADRAGILPGDIIVEFAGKPVGSMKEVAELLDAGKVGKPVKVVLRRAGNSMEFTVIPEEARPDM